MALVQATTVLEGQAPTKSNQIVVRGPGDVNIDVYRGYQAITLDGAATTATINFIDGTQALQYAPSVLIVTTNYVSGTASPIAVAVSTITSTSFAVKLSSAGTSTDVINLAFICLK